jgi:hypothetical protein
MVLGFCIGAARRPSGVASGNDGNGATGSILLPYPANITNDNVLL